jgi:hypothetical protein
MSAAARRAANPLLLACDDLSEACLDDLMVLAPAERARLRGLALRWADLAGYLDGQEIADHIADRQDAGLHTFNPPPGRT